MWYIVRYAPSTELQGIVDDDTFLFLENCRLHAVRDGTEREVAPWKVVEGASPAGRFAATHGVALLDVASSAGRPSVRAVRCRDGAALAETRSDHRRGGGRSVRRDSER